MSKTLLRGGRLLDGVAPVSLDLRAGTVGAAEDNAGVRRGRMQGHGYARPGMERDAATMNRRFQGLLQGDPQAWFQGDLDVGLKLKVEGLIAARISARSAKDWPTADRIRDELNALNVEVMDNPTGATWRLKETT